MVKLIIDIKGGELFVTPVIPVNIKKPTQQEEFLGACVAKALKWLYVETDGSPEIEDLKNRVIKEIVDLVKTETQTKENKNGST